jgi:PQQ-dependent catabolism-associated CXXCW motif protein
MNHILSMVAGFSALVLLPQSSVAQDTFGGAQQPQYAPPPQQQGGYPPPRPSQGPAPAPAQRPAANLDKMMQQERQDFGVAPTKQLHSGAMHGPTPASIPGGQVITTKGLVSLVQGRQVPYMIFDILGGPETLPGAIPAAAASQGGTFDDQTQKGFGTYLQQATQGKKQTALIFYCQSTHCWMSYNAALRAINMGYSNVLWYRGGIEAWKAAGLPMQQAGNQQGGQQGGNQQGGQQPQR